jgi:hypothetical protein
VLAPGLLVEAIRVERLLVPAAALPEVGREQWCHAHQPVGHDALPTGRVIHVAIHACNRVWEGAKARAAVLAGLRVGSPGYQRQRQRHNGGCCALHPP